jgi:hypothetical protein
VVTVTARFFSMLIDDLVSLLETIIDAKAEISATEYPAEVYDRIRWAKETFKLRMGEYVDDRIWAILMERENES